MYTDFTLCSAHELVIIHYKYLVYINEIHIVLNV
jgi:hypothetical protein